MAKFRGAVLKCVQCGSEFRVPPSRAATASTCSHECAVVQRGLSIRRKVQKTCKGCGAIFEMPRSHADRRVYCSAECKHGAADFRRAIVNATTGARNARWKGGRTRHNEGYVYLSAPSHPFSSNGYVFEHRLVMERWLVENDPESEFLIEVYGRKYLSPHFIVHHKDEVRDNNAIENLQCMTAAEHHSHHHHGS